MPRTKGHSPEVDRLCERCGMMIQKFIPHECNPDICAVCNGKKEVFIGREEGVWIGSQKCAKCKGTGRTIWDE